MAVDGWEGAKRHGWLSAGWFCGGAEGCWPSAATSGSLCCAWYVGVRMRMLSLPMPLLLGAGWRGVA